MQAKINAVVGGEIIRCQRLWPSCEARPHVDDPMRVQPSADGNHVLGHLLAKTDPNIMGSHHYAALMSSLIDDRDPVMRSGSAMLHDMISPVPKVGANLDNVATSRVFRSGLPTPQLTLNPS
jgi:hypothetical protein